MDTGGERTLTLEQFLRDTSAQREFDSSLFVRSFLNAISTYTLGPCDPENVEDLRGTEVAVGLGMEFDEPTMGSDLNPTDVCATSSAIFTRWLVQTQRDDSAEMHHGWHHQEEWTNEARCQSRAERETLSPFRSNKTIKVEGVAWRRLSFPSTRSWAPGTWWALHTTASRSCANSFKLCCVPVPSAKTGSQVSAATPFARECDRFEVTLELFMQGLSRRAETYFALVSFSIFADRVHSLRFFAVSAPRSLALDLHLWVSLSKKP